ncbi:MAG: thioredoxin family protein [Thermoleophilia bacterium]|nr:thioredoxin family protein [Thermoleophilia bacterium]
MDKKALTLVAVIAVVVGGGLIYTLAGGSSDDSDEVTAAAPAQEKAAGAGDSATDGSATSGDEAAADGNGSGNGGAGGDASSAPGEYVDYSPELVSSTSGTKLLFFHAPWCSQCEALESDIETNGLPNGVTVFKVDFDSNQDLRQEYGVTIQTTMVKVDRDGKKLDSYVAYEQPTVEAVEQALVQ